MNFCILVCLFLGATIYYITIAKTLPLLYFSYWVLILTTAHFSLQVVAQIKDRFNY